MLRPIGPIFQTALAKFIVEETDTFGGLQPIERPGAGDTHQTAPSANRELESQQVTHEHYRK